MFSFALLMFLIMQIPFDSFIVSLCIVVLCCVSMVWHAWRCKYASGKTQKCVCCLLLRCRSLCAFINIWICNFHHRFYFMLVSRCFFVRWFTYKRQRRWAHFLTFCLRKKIQSHFYCHAHSGCRQTICECETLIYNWIIINTEPFFSGRNAGADLTLSVLSGKFIVQQNSSLPQTIQTMLWHDVPFAQYR